MQLNLIPNYKNLIFWLTIRKLVLFITIYNIYLLDISYAKFISAFIANVIGFPLKLIAIKSSYPILNIDFRTIKKTALIDIIKSSINDGIPLYLIYNF